MASRITVKKGACPASESQGRRYPFAQKQRWATSLCAFDGKRPVGQVNFDLLNSDEFAQVATMEVIPEYRRQRVGTALYEAAARASCKAGKKLRSDVTRSDSAEAFWKKQWRKGRARALLVREMAIIHAGKKGRDPGDVNPDDYPLHEDEFRDFAYVYELRDCPKTIDLSGVAGARRIQSKTQRRTRRRRR